MRDDKNSGQRSFSGASSQGQGGRPSGPSSRPQGAGAGMRREGTGGGAGGAPRPAGGHAGGAGRPASSAPRPGFQPRPAGSTMGGRPASPSPAPRRPAVSGLQRPAHDGPRMNDMITAREVLFIDQDGNKIGAISLREALEKAVEAGLDLVEIAPNAEPPVCKVMDYGKHKYQEQKKAAEARKKQKVVEVKEIKMRPNIDDHDYDVKMKAIRRFLEDGDKVKITLRFRGRELSHTDIGMKVLEKVQEDIRETAKIELAPKVEGRQAVMVISPQVTK